MLQIPRGSSRRVLVFSFLALLAAPFATAGAVTTAEPVRQGDEAPSNGGNLAPLDALIEAAAVFEDTSLRDPRYLEGSEWYRRRNGRKAAEIFIELAKENPRAEGVLGMVVASVASSGLSRQEVQALMDDADAHPDDPLRQFIAGAATHYYAHNDGKSVEEKQKYYELCLHFLGRAEAYDFEPRLYIYRAVSHFRLGNQALAEELIEKAVARAGEDPDAYYCRAEIFQRTNTERSLDDLRLYIDMQERQARNGAVVSKPKMARVRLMQEYLEAVHRGDMEPMEIFDPVSGWDSWMVTLRLHGLRYLGVGVTVLAGGVLLVWAARRRRRGDDA